MNAVRPLVDYIADARRLEAALREDEEQSGRQRQAGSSAAHQQQQQQPIGRDPRPLQKRRRDRSRTPAPRASSNPPPAGPAQQESESALLRRLNRCTKCAHLLRGPISEHLASGQCDPATRARRVNGIRYAIREGRDPNNLPHNSAGGKPGPPSRGPGPSGGSGGGQHPGGGGNGNRSVHFAK